MAKNQGTPPDNGKENANGYNAGGTNGTTKGSNCGTKYPQIGPNINSDAADGSDTNDGNENGAPTDGSAVVVDRGSGRMEIDFDDDNSDEEAACDGMKRRKRRKTRETCSSSSPSPPREMEEEDYDSLGGSWWSLPSGGSDDEMITKDGENTVHRDESTGMERHDGQIQLTSARPKMTSTASGSDDRIGDIFVRGTMSSPDRESKELRRSHQSGSCCDDGSNYYDIHEPITTGLPYRRLDDVDIINKHSI